MNFRSIVNIGLILTFLSLSACGGSSSGGDTNYSTSHPEFFRSKATLQASYYPEGDIAETMPTFNWRSFPKATEYRFGHEPTGDSSQWLEYYTSAIDAGCPNNGDICQYTPSDYTFPLNVEQVWWLQSKVNGKWYQWSKPIIFTVVGGNGGGAVATLIAPTGDIHTTTPEFSWNSVNGATDYMLGYEDKNTSEGWQVHEFSNSDANCQTAQTCVYTPTNPNFSVGQNIAWWVKAKINGAWQAWSSSGLFTVIDTQTGSNIPTPIAPVGNINTTNPEFSWTSVNGASNYMLAYEDADTSNGFEQYELTDAEANCQTGQTCRYTPNNPNFSAGQRIAWWVKAKAKGEWSEWSKTGVFTINQTQIERPFIMKVDISGVQKKQFKLMVLSENNAPAINYDIDCDSDGNKEGVGITGDHICEYPSNGIYRVTLTGSFPHIQTGRSLVHVIDIEQWGTQQWSSMNASFRNSKISQFTATDTPDLSKVTDMSYMFSSSQLFNQDISNWDVSNVTNMNGMFNRTAFNQPLNNWDVSNVTNMSWMFQNTHAFNQDISNWDVSNVTNMHSMFIDAQAFNQDISMWDVSNVTNMNRMFSGAKSFNQPLNNWNVSNVTNMYGMFHRTRASYVENFNQPLNNWDVSNVTNMQQMFEGAKSFNQPLNNWNVSKVTYMVGMFQEATAFNQPLNTWDVGAVTDMGDMFADTTAFNQPLNNWDVSNVTSLSGMFQNARAFNQDISNWDVSKADQMSRMFYEGNLTTENYDNMLTKWSSLNLQNGVEFGAGTTKYSQSATAARNRLINDFGWTITDGGQL